MSLILRYVDLTFSSVVIEKSFLGFINVNDTIGQGLFDVLLQESKSFDLDVDNGYDNESKGVQKKLLDINRRAFYTPCGTHSLNLMLCDMTNTYSKDKDFFGVIQHAFILYLHIRLKDESRVDSVRAIRFPIVDIREALLQVSENDNDSKIKMAIVKWYDMLNYVNSVSKSLQSIDMLIDVVIDIIKGLVSFFERYRDVGFSSAIKEAKKNTIELDIDPLFSHRRQIRRKKYFDENSNDEPLIESQSPEDAFRINYFLYMVNQAISSLNRRFEQYEYEKIFGFLFISTKLNALDDVCLKSSCDALEVPLKNDDCNDVDANELYVEKVADADLIEDFVSKNSRRLLLLGFWYAYYVVVL
uniref:DUF4371 domain-containing protein n=1 Tax=Kalanchoe fedtschenkoi TaxID=63787 RepID=A0A7N0TYT2_KALFE